MSEECTAADLQALIEEMRRIVDSIPSASELEHDYWQNESPIRKDNPLIKLEHWEPSKHSGGIK